MSYRYAPLSQARRGILKKRQLARCANSGLASVIERNIDAIEEHRQEADAARSTQEHVADAITWFSGSMPFIYFHVFFFGIWILMNLEPLGLPAFDPYPFGMLTTIVSLEAIFLSTFVLVSQNRQAIIADRRNELDLQINLLTEYEVTRILLLVDELAKQFPIHIDPCQAEELQELEEDVRPDELLGELEARAEQIDRPQSGAS
jgi:uncharacterized membrane protein